MCACVRVCCRDYSSVSYQSHTHTDDIPLNPAAAAAYTLPLLPFCSQEVTWRVQQLIISSCSPVIISSLIAFRDSHVDFPDIVPSDLFIIHKSQCKICHSGVFLQFRQLKHMRYAKSIISLNPFPISY